MDEVQVDQKTFEMPPREGITIAQFLTVSDLERSAKYYATVFGGEIVSMGDGNAPPYIKIANIWMILNVGGGPTPDKPTVTLRTPPDPNVFSSFMNIRVADIAKCYTLWKSRGATFLTEPIEKYGETRCYIRDPDGYIIEVGQSTPGYREVPSGEEMMIAQFLTVADPARSADFYATVLGGEIVKHG